MRYFAGFVGGLVVGLLLFLLQRHLIAPGDDQQPSPPPIITLKPVPFSKPVEPKPYEPEPPPPKPEEVVRPTTTPIATTPTTTAPPLDIETISGQDLPAVPPAPPDGRPGDATTIGWGTLDGTLVVLVAVAPQYPGAATRDGVEGFVELEFTVLADGSVDDIAVVRAEPPGVFERSARDALRRWKFQPRVIDGQVVPTRARQLFEYSLQQE